MVINFPDEWGVKKQWPPVYEKDITKLITHQTGSHVIYVLRSSVPELTLGDIVIVDGRKRILINSIHDYMDEYWVANSPTRDITEADIRRFETITHRLKKRGDDANKIS